MNGADKCPANEFEFESAQLDADLKATSQLEEKFVLNDALYVDKECRKLLQERRDAETARRMMSSEATTSRWKHLRRPIGLINSFGNGERRRRASPRSPAPFQIECRRDAGRCRAD